MKKLSRIIQVWCALIFLLVTIGGGTLNVHAASSPFTGPVRFERLTVEDGLPNETVLSVIQDRQGFMWFATADGVSRYDGYSFTTFRRDINNPNSLSNNNTFSLVESKDGLIWIGTDPGGLNVYNPDTGKFSVYQHKDGDPASLPDNSIWSLCESSDGSIWVGTRGGLSRLERSSGKFTNYLPDANNPRALAGAVVYRIYQDRSGVIWVGTRNALQRFDPATDDFTSFVNDPNDPNSISSNNVWAMLEDSQGVFWVGTRGGGLNRFDRATGKFSAYRMNLNDPTSLSDDRLWNIFEDHAGNLWALTENGGLNLFDRQTETFQSFKHNPNDGSTLSHNDVFWMTEDRSGVLWVASRYGGVNKLYPALSRFGLYRSIPLDPNTLSSNVVYSVLVDPNNIIWMGTFGGGLNRYDRKTGKMTVYKNDPKDLTSLSNDKIYDLFRDEQGILWVSTSGGGLNRMDSEAGVFTHYNFVATAPAFAIGSNFVTKIRSAGPDHLWIGTLGYGLNYFNKQTGLMEKEYVYVEGNPNSLTEDTVYDLAVDQTGGVWIATARGGLEYLDPKTDTFTHHRNDPQNLTSLLSDAVYSIYLDETNGVIWAGTDSGLSRLNLSTQEWQNYTTKDGLPSDSINGIQPGNEGEVLLSTGKGISRFNYQQKVFTNFDVHDGLQGDQFVIASSSRGPDGEIFFGGSNGVNFFRPEHLTSNTYKAPVVFTEFQLFNQTVPNSSDILPTPVERTKEIILNYDQSVFTIKFAALSYQLSAKNLYQYKMENFDQDWSPPRTKRDVTYTSLPPGTYTFLVRAANNDGVWNEQPASIVIIKILPPWWETWWFRILAGLTIVGVVFGGIQMRINRIRSLNKELEKRVTERTSELNAAQEELRQVNGQLQNRLEAITKLEKEVRELAGHDALTGLYNRHYLPDRLEAEYSRSKREQHSIAFMLVDIDHFKLVNDTYGHQAGDRILKATSQTILGQIRRSDIACRYGGEEFLIVMPEVKAEDALQRAEFFRKSIEELRVEEGDHVMQITVSVGVAIYPAHGVTNDKILGSVDAALYEAKKTGRNKVVLYR